MTLARRYMPALVALAIAGLYLGLRASPSSWEKLAGAADPIPVGPPPSVTLH